MKQTQQGLTLIEILVSLVVVLLISALSLQVIPISKINRDANVDQTVTLRVKAYMEDLSFAMQTKTTFDTASTTNPPIAQFVSGIYTCVPVFSDPDNITAPGVALRKRVVLTCTAPKKSNLVFATEFGRPE
ncbi:prepilin-type N-terminal cleavage/methylation domain-containing protein [Deinococcus misasensis]|uniref:prepilin-type N-terminal cleavage/methylation domain-containing protein n=1 Tax=Deinococcus misasensis TaxID=392413 RepID=UPI000552DEB4|nr:prepilin-type N-terminal cleavage/methylation domain-containing protein [Deinococcus misasensis]